MIHARERDEIGIYLTAADLGELWNLDENVDRDARAFSVLTQGIKKILTDEETSLLPDCKEGGLFIVIDELGGCPSLCEHFVVWHRGLKL